MTKIIDSTNLGYLISKIKSSFWPKSDVVQIGLDNSPTSGSDNLVKSGGVYSALGNKQDTLVSGTNIKTINNESILGSGNLTISSGSSVTESTVSGWGFTKNTGTYSKPSGGIPASDLESAVQTSLGKADTALQSFTETDPVFSASPAAGITSSDITNWNSKTSNTGTLTGVKFNNVDATVTNGVASISATIPAEVTESTVSGWGFTKNAGTLTGVKVNGSNATVTSGVADIGTVITSETQLSKGTTSGSGNAVTDISVSNHQITLTKGSTFLTAHQSIKTINNQTITGTGNLTLDTLPTVSASDNGKILMVVNGAWTLVSPVTIYSGSGEPNNSVGNNGDIYLQT